MEDNKLLFAKKLEELVAAAKKKKNVLEYQEVLNAFSSMALDADQSEKIFDYLGGLVYFCSYADRKGVE